MGILNSLFNEFLNSFINFVLFISQFFLLFVDEVHLDTNFLFHLVCIFNFQSITFQQRQLTFISFSKQNRIKLLHHIYMCLHFTKILIYSLIQPIGQRNNFFMQLFQIRVQTKSIKYFLYCFLCFNCCAINSLSC